MSNKTNLQTNNTSLDGYINRTNALIEVASELPEIETNSTCYVGTSEPDSTIGVDGDIYILKE